MSSNPELITPYPDVTLIPMLKKLVPWFFILGSILLVAVGIFLLVTRPRKGDKKR